MSQIAAYSVRFGEIKGIKNLATRQVWERQLPKVLNQIGLLVQREVIKKLNTASFKNSAGLIQKSIKFRVDLEKSRVIIYSDPSVAPYAKYQESGVKRHQMRYLLKAVRAIPLEFADVKGITFRRATEKSMQDGRWVHPGYEGKHFFRDGVKEAVKLVQERLKSLVVSIVVEE